MAHLARLGRDPRKCRKGRLLVLKPGRVGDENVDVHQYGIENNAFPQQTTADQWFDEQQFESYRRLGLFTGAQASTLTAKLGRRRGGFRGDLRRILREGLR